LYSFKHPSCIKLNTSVRVSFPRNPRIVPKKDVELPVGLALK
jgi:hypothetical protein